MVPTRALLGSSSACVPHAGFRQLLRIGALPAFVSRHLRTDREDERVARLQGFGEPAVPLHPQPQETGAGLCRRYCARQQRRARIEVRHQLRRHAFGNVYILKNLIIGHEPSCFCFRIRNKARRHHIFVGSKC